MDKLINVVTGVGSGTMLSICFGVVSIDNALIIAVLAFGNMGLQVLNTYLINRKKEKR